MEAVSNIANMPLVIETTFKTLDLSAINLIKEEFTIDYYIEFQWRVNANYCVKAVEKLASNKTDLTKPILITGKSISKQIWIPDLIIERVRAMAQTLEPVLTINIINSNFCHLTVNKRESATVGCPLDLHAYPFDTQICSIKMRSANYPSNEVKYEWLSTDPNDKTSVNTTLSLPKPINYSYLMVTYYFVRQITTFSIQFFYPTTLIVFIAYCSAWITVESGPGRFLLCILPFLTLVATFNGIKGTLPSISYVIAIDIWYMICMMFVFTAIGELTLVNYLHKKRSLIVAKRKRDKEDQPIAVQHIPNGFGHRIITTADMMAGLEGDQQRRRSSYAPKAFWNQFSNNFHINVNNDNNNGIHVMADNEPIDRALQVDRVFRVIYPICFAIFVIAFWVTYMS
ncbi:unnamed protein product, partial [Medioppia subpectinata]